MQVEAAANCRVVTPRAVLFSRHRSRDRSTAHGGVIPPPSQVLRSVEGIACSSALSCVSAKLRCVGSRLRSVSVRPVALAFNCLPAFVLREYPKVTLTPAFASLKRAASARKRTRIAERLAKLAGQPRQQVMTNVESKESSWRALSDVVGSVMSSLGPRAETAAENPRRQAQRTKH